MSVAPMTPADLRKELSFSELIKTINGIDPRTFTKKSVKIGFSSNLTVDPSVYFFKKHSYLRGMNCELVFGDYNSHITNVGRFIDEKADIIILQNLFDNIMPAFEAHIQSVPSEMVDGLIERFIQEMRLALDNSRECKNVIVDKLYLSSGREVFNVSYHSQEILARFNKALENLVQNYENARLMDPEQIVRRIGLRAAVNQRHYYMFKAFYSNEFWNQYCEQILLSTRYGQSYFYKVVVLDCDNTLWGGIIGEDLMDGIKLDRDSYPGNVFWRVQNELMEFQKYGVLLCLCSKNNPADVDEVLSRHPTQVLKDDHLILKKVNWNSKVQNIRELAEELDLGLESFIFIDDSDFEVAAVREMLPQVTVFQVPKKIFEYPAMIAEVRDLLFAGGVSAESIKKTTQYKQRALAIQEKSNHETYEDYLSALQIKVGLNVNSRDKIVRIAELTQKSNQFNLTTQRYTEADILRFMDSSEHAVYAINVADKFGDSGLTGIVIVKKEGTTAVIDTFLMSCRVIGRTIEYSFWTPIFEYFRSRGCTSISACYIESLKNAQVSDFYDKLGLELVSQEGKVKNYRADINMIKNKIEKLYVEVKSDF